MATSSPPYNAGDRIVLVTIILLLLLLVVFVVALINISNTFQNQHEEYKASEAPQVAIKPTPAKTIAPPVSIALTPAQAPTSRPARASKAPTAAVVPRKKQPTKPMVVTPVKRPSPAKPRTQKVIRPAPPIPESGYLKLGANGQVLPHNATEWACVQDRATGLIWEVKTNDRSLRNRNNFFTWYDPAADRNHGVAGMRDAGRCKGGVDCDTQAYVKAINQHQLCGFSDWRLPSRIELLTLIDSSKQSKASIDVDYFPHTVPSWYWTASSNPDKPEYAWFVMFRSGVALNALKHHPKHIRLVRSTKNEKKTLNRLAFKQ